MTNFKRLVYGTVLAVSSLLPGSLMAAGDSIDVTVPFAFVVGGHPMPAGSYVIETSKTDGIVLLRGAGSSVLVATGPGGSLSADGKPGLVFQKKGSAAYLVGVQTGELPSRAIPLHSFDRASTNPLQ